MTTIQDILKNTASGGQSSIYGTNTAPIASAIGGTTQGTPAYSAPSTQYVAPTPAVPNTTYNQNASIAGNQGYSAPVTTNNSNAVTTPAVDVSKFQYNQTPTDTTMSGITDYYKGQSDIVVPTQQDAYSRQLALHQAEIDAANRVYNDMLAKTRIESANRSGSASARQARGGLLGSERGAAIDTQTSQFNQSQEQAVENQRLAAISSIMGTARADAAKEIADKQAAKKEGYDKYAEQIGRTSETRKANLSALAISMLTSGVDPSTLKPDEIATIAKTYGASSADVISAYKSAKVSEDKNKLETQKTQSEIIKNNGQTLSEGQTYVQYNPVTKKYETVASGTPKPGTADFGGTYVKGANPIVDSWAQRIFDGSAKITDIPASQGGLRNAVTVALQSSGNDLNGRPTVTEIGLKAKATAQSLLDKFNNGKGTSVVGASRAFGGGIAFPGSDSANFLTDFNSLKSQLALEGAKLLKGQGQVSDSERALLNQAVTKLNLSQSEPEFKATLEGIINTLNGTPEYKSQTQNSNSSMTADEEQHLLDSGVSPETIRQMKSGGLTKVGGDTNQATQIANAIKQTESGGNYNAIGDAGTSAGAYQFQPDSWSGWSQKYLGQSNLPMTPENQDAVATARIQDLLNQGYDAREIALIWNGGSPVVKKGFNKKIGLAYDSGAYAEKVLQNLTA